MTIEAVGEAVVEPDLTPMLDVVFILLIFFVVTATFVKEAGIDLPSHDSVQRNISTSQSIVIEINDDNRYFVNGQHADKRALINHLSRLHAESPELPLIIKPALDAEIDSLVFALDIGKLVNLTTSIAAPSE